MDPYLSSRIIFQKKMCSKYIIFIKWRCTTIKKNHLLQDLACKEILIQGLKCFYLPSMLPTVSVPHSSHCTDPWSRVKHLIFETLMVHLGLHWCRGDFSALSIIWPQRFVKGDDSRARKIKKPTDNQVCLRHEEFQQLHVYIMDRKGWSPLFFQNKYN